MLTFVLFAMIGLGMYAQYWYDRAHRLMDAMQYMIEADIEDVGQSESSCDDREEEIEDDE